MYPYDEQSRAYQQRHSAFRRGSKKSVTPKSPGITQLKITISTSSAPPPNMGGKARGGLEGPSKTEDEVTLKVLLAAGTALLRPPAPLPVEPTELVRRLEASGSLVPERWQSSRSAWRGLSAIAEAVEDSSTPTIPPKSDDGHLDHDRPSVGKNHLDRAQAMLLVGERCLDLVVGLQGWLEKEFWPSRFNDGLESRDCESS